MDGGNTGHDGFMELILWEQAVDVIAVVVFLELTVRGQDGGCNGCDGFLGLYVGRQKGECNGSYVFLELNMWEQDGGYNSKMEETEGISE